MAHALNCSLSQLVNCGQFAAAERLRLKIVSNGFRVWHRPEYARVALAALRNYRLTGASGHKLAEYQTWLELVPDRQSQHHHHHYPFDPIIQELTYRASKPNFRPFLSQTGLVIAGKGFAKRHFLDLARPIVISAPETSPCLTDLLYLEPLAAQYEANHHLPPTHISQFIRGSLIQLFSQRGWYSKTLNLIFMPREYPLQDIVYQSVLDLIPQHSHKRRQILKLWEEDKSQRLCDFKIYSKPSP